jgi:outer membrane protein assembly factor BamB
VPGDLLDQPRQIECLAVVDVVRLDEARREGLGATAQPLAALIRKVAQRADDVGDEGGKILVRARLHDRDRRLIGEETEQLDVAEVERRRVAAVEEFQHTDHAFVEVKRDAEDRPRQVTERRSHLGCQVLVGRNVGERHRLPAGGDQTGQSLVERNTALFDGGRVGADRHREDELVTVLVEKEEMSGGAGNRSDGGFDDQFEQTVVTDGGADRAGRGGEGERLAQLLRRAVGLDETAEPFDLGRLPRDGRSRLGQIVTAVPRRSVSHRRAPCHPPRIGPSYHASIGSDTWCARSGGRMPGVLRGRPRPPVPTLPNGVPFARKAKVQRSDDEEAEMKRDPMRRFVGAIVLVAWLAAPRATAAQATPVAGGGGVPMFRGDPAHTGVAPGPGPSGNPPAVLWSFKPNGFEVRSSPAVVDGTVYIGHGDHNLYALDAASGTVRWAFATGDHVVSSPAVADGTVVVGSDDGTLYAVDAATGDERWHLDAGGAVAASPVIANGTVYVVAKSGDFWAVDLQSGAPIIHGGASGTISSPAYVDGVVYVGCSCGALHALDMASMQQMWQFETGDAIASSPAVVDGVVYVGSDDGSVYAVDAATGKERWHAATGDKVESSPAVADGVVYVGSEDHALYALAAATGEVRWKLDLGDKVDSSPVVAAGVVYVGGEDNRFHAVDANTGKERWAVESEGDVYDSPAVIGGVVYFAAADGSVLAVGRPIGGEKG